MTLRLGVTPTDSSGQMRPYHRSPLPIEQGQSGVLVVRDRTSDLMSVAQPEMAQRWVVKAHIDDNTCDPCRKNDGVTYKNRADAYADYPNGRGYRHCVGAEYGNTCRCKITKRGRKGRTGGSMSRDLAAMIAKAQMLTAGASARNMLPLRPDGAPAMATLQDFRAEANTLYLYDAIGGWDGTQARDVAQALASMTGPVTLRINSPGGIIFEGAAIYNALKQYAGGPVTAYVDGYAASAASFVMLAASPYDAATDTGGVRLAENAFVMVHDGMGLAIGTADDMRDVADLLDMLSDSIAQIYATRTGGTAEEWRNTMTDGDTWYTAQGALDAGLADLIVGRTAEDPAIEESAEAQFDLSLFQPVASAAPENNPFDFVTARDALKGALSA